ncbi:MAG: methyltransferase [Bacteroidota bacterium]|nr:methyltransferase [Bacteroidota bacterium]
MGNPCFHFKRFDVYHDRCAMKVGTDGVLLGAWADVLHAGRILDVGTGSGLIALMVAQRTEKASIDALEIDPEGAGQAKENFTKSPWPDRLNLVQADAVTWQAAPYDLIVSNPPFYRNALKAPSHRRKLARHDDTLTWEQLAKLASRLLTKGGKLAVVLPAEADQLFDAICWDETLYLVRRCDVSTRPGQPPKRLLLEFSTEKTPMQRSALTIETDDHIYTDDYSFLTADFYL